MGGYILLKIDAGFNDALSILWNHVEYAKTHDRTIILCLRVYGATKIEELIDFSNFPVPVLCGESHIKHITFSSIEPSCFELDPYRSSDPYILLENGHWLSHINRVPTKFDITKTYPDDVLLIFLGFGNFGGSLKTLCNIKFQPTFLEKFYKQRSLFDKFVAIHLRATDYPGYKEEEDTKKVADFVKKHPGIPTYIASDDSVLVNKLCKKYKQLVKPLSYKEIDTKNCGLHYSAGKTDSSCLANALIDILMCATASDFLQSRGGFSCLIAQLRASPDVLEKLTSTVEEPGESRTSDSCAEA